MFTCYKSSCSDNLLTQSCLFNTSFTHLFFRYSQACFLVKTSLPHLFVRYSQSCVLKASFRHLVVSYSQHSLPVKSSIIKYYSLRGSAKSITLIRAISEAFLLGLNSSALTFIIGSLVDGVISQDISKRYRCCAACSK